MTSGGLKKVQEINAEPGSQLAEYINTINNCFPEEIVKLVNFCFFLVNRIGRDILCVLALHSDVLLRSLVSAQTERANHVM